MSDDRAETDAAAAVPPRLPGFPLDRAEFLQAILDSTNLPIYLKDQDGQYVFVNRQYERLAKVPREVVYGKYDADLFPEPVARLFREQDLEVMRRRELVEFEETIPLPDGVFSFITAKFPLLDAAGRVYAVGGVCTDITLRKQLSEETLAGERERLAVTLRSIGVGVISTDTDGKVILLNPAAEAITGWSSADAVGRPVEEVCFCAGDRGAAPGAAPLRRALRDGETVGGFEDTVIGRYGTQRAVIGSAAPVRDQTGRIVGAVLSLRDVTEQRRLAEELFNSRKLEAVGLLAGGIAHDFNNILEGILGNLDLAATRVAPDAAARRYLDAAQRAAVRARGLTRQLLTFSRGGNPVKEVSSLDELIRDSASFVLAGSSVSCEFEVPDDLWLVEIDRGQLSQVIQNLVLNARQAMSGGGVIRIRCANVVAAADELELGLPAGRYVSLVLTDQGPGVPAAIADRIFEPYFTTREGGSGLGLAVAFAVVRKHGGRISVAAGAGGGACFTILLPAADGAVTPVADAASVPLRVGGRVLIVDDDEDVREVAGAIVQQLGFEVAFAVDGREAVAAYGAALAAGARFALVIMDLTIPGGMGGVAATREILGLDPAARVIVSSGYSDDPCLANYREHGFVGAAVKPYTIAELRQRIAAVLG